MKFLCIALALCSISSWSTEIEEECLFMLKPSTIEGVGLFAATDIPKGTVVPSYQQFCTRILKISEVPKEFIKYCVFLNDTECACPERFDLMPVGCYINHSDQPNLVQHSPTTRITIRDISAGEEILVDYTELDEPEELKEEYYSSNP